MWIIPRWFHNTRMCKPFLILLCRSWACWAGCLSTHPLLGRFQPSSCHWLTLFVFSSIPASLPAMGTMEPCASSFSSLLGAVAYPLLPASIPASQAHSLGITFHFGLSLSPCTQALLKSHRVCLRSAATPPHPGQPLAQPLLYASLWPCRLRSHVAWTCLHDSAQVISQPSMLTLSPVLMSPSQSPSSLSKPFCRQRPLIPHWDMANHCHLRLLFITFSNKTLSSYWHPDFPPLHCF